LTAIYGGVGGDSGFGGIYSSILSSYMDILTKSYSLPGAGSPTGGYNQPVYTAGAGSSGSNSGSGSGTTNTTGSGKKKSNTGMIVGIVVGSVAGVAMVGAIVWYFCRKKRNPTPPLQQYPQPAYAAQAAQIDAKPPQAYQFPHQLTPAGAGGPGIVPQQQVPPVNAVYAVQGAGYQVPTPPPPPPPPALEMSGDTQFLPPQQHQQQPQYGPPRNGTPGPLVEMDAGERR